MTSAANWTSMPLVFGILAFVYSGHGVFPSVRASMKVPEDFPKVTQQGTNHSMTYGRPEILLIWGLNEVAPTPSDLLRQSLLVAQ